MTKMKCPGQDTRFWSPDDICEFPCKSCGAVVEFFKDDVTRHCPGCGRRIVNPRVQLGCAEWCEHAEECLGTTSSQGESDLGGRQAPGQRAEKQP